MNTGDYPIGAKYDSKAPYNEKQLPEREIEVCISVTLSKTVKLKVSDYNIIDEGIDEDGSCYEDIDYSDCNLNKAAEEQIILPQDKFSDWSVDEFECVLE